MVSVPIQCSSPDCGYEWVTKSKNRWVICPRCHATNPVPAPRVQVLARNVAMDTRCDRCATDAPAFLVCRTELGESLILCERCTGDLEKEGGKG